MLGEDVAAARPAPFAKRAWRLVPDADIVGTARDAHRLRPPQREGIDRRGRPVPARFAMAVAHGGRLAAHGQMDRAAEAAALVDFSVAHDIPFFRTIGTIRFAIAPTRRDHSRMMTISRYSLGTTIEPSTARLRLAIRIFTSRSSTA